MAMFQLRRRSLFSSNYTTRTKIYRVFIVSATLKFSMLSHLPSIIPHHLDLYTVHSIFIGFRVHITSHLSVQDVCFCVWLFYFRLWPIIGWRLKSDSVSCLSQVSRCRAILLPCSISCRIPAATLNLSSKSNLTDIFTRLVFL